MSQQLYWSQLSNSSQETIGRATTSKYPFPFPPNRYINDPNNDPNGAAGGGPQSKNISRPRKTPKSKRLNKQHLVHQNFTAPRQNSRNTSSQQTHTEPPSSSPSPSQSESELGFPLSYYLRKMAATSKGSPMHGASASQKQKQLKRKSSPPPTANKRSRTTKFEYCGPRTHPDKIIPIGDEELLNLHDENPYPQLPYAPEIMKVIKKMKKDWDAGLPAIPVVNQAPNNPSSQQATPTHGSQMSHVSQTQPLQYRKKRSANDRFNPTDAEIIEGLAQKDIDISSYVVRSFYEKLTRSDIDRLTIYIKNRLVYCLEWSVPFKNSVVRDALGIDEEHPGWAHAFSCVTALRASNQSKILQRAHSYAVKYFDTAQGRQYGRENYGKLPYTEVIDELEKDGHTIQRPNVPKTSTFPDHFMSIATATDVFYDVREGIDWDGLYRKRDRSLPLNHLGRGLIRKTATFIQAEILNALRWVDTNGIYRRPTITKKKKSVEAPFKRSPTVMQWIHDSDVFCRVIQACPTVTKLHMDLHVSGHAVHGKIPNVGCLYPIPKCLSAPRHRNVTSTTTTLDYIHEDALVAEAMRDSDKEDSSSEEEEEDEDEDDDELEVEDY